MVYDKEKRKENYEKNKEARREYSRKYYRENKERIKEYLKKKKDTISKKRSDYYLKNKEKFDLERNLNRTHLNELIYKSRDKYNETYKTIDYTASISLKDIIPSELTVKEFFEKLITIYFKQTEKPIFYKIKNPLNNQSKTNKIRTQIIISKEFYNKLKIENPKLLDSQIIHNLIVFYKIPNIYKKIYNALPSSIQKRKEYSLKNKERTKEYFKKYHEENKEKINKKKKEYYEENKEKIIDKVKRYWKRKPAKRKKLDKKYYKKRKMKI